ncbi:trypsin-like serine protease [Rhodobacteraceae bacterium LMO-12]|nr:trypsin-like serine protease [Rhodobacteraceae bacterium LMO-JJ12]
MLRLFLIALFATIATTADAEDARLKRLATGDDNRGWEAVGRLDIDGKRFCTGALIAPNLVLTAAHCLFEKESGVRINHEKIEFLAGWRDGRASAYRWVKRAVVHPEYSYSARLDAVRVGNDVALLELHHPIRNTRVVPFETDSPPHKGDKIGIVSYARNRSEAPSMQEVCWVKDWQTGVLVMTCDVDFGSSGAPVFVFDEAGTPRIVSVVSGMAVVDGERVSLGTQLEEPLALLKAELAANNGMFTSASRPKTKRLNVGARGDTGAKFVKP